MRWLVAAFAALFVLSACSPSAKTMLSETVMVYDDYGHGSGVLVGPHTILTAGHVAKHVRGAGDASFARFNDGHVSPIHVLWVSETADIGLLWIDDDKSYPAAEIACRAPEVGEPITLAGNPLQIENALSFGHIASGTHLSLFQAPPGLDPDTINLFKTHWALDIAAAPGNSGGPVFDSQGEVIGILVAGLPQPGASGMFPEFSPFVLMIPSSIVCGMRF